MKEKGSYSSVRRSQKGMGTFFKLFGEERKKRDIGDSSRKKKDGTMSF